MEQYVMLRKTIAEGSRMVIFQGDDEEAAPNPGLNPTAGGNGEPAAG